MAVVGCSSISSNTQLDKDNDFFLITSYGWVDTAEDEQDQHLREIVDSTMQSRGYDATDADYADITLHSGFYTKEDSTLDSLNCSPVFEASQPGLKSVWMIAMISPMTDCEVWKGQLVASPETYAEKTDKIDEETVELFEEFPPEHSTMDYVRALLQYLFGSGDD